MIKTVKIKKFKGFESLEINDLSTINLLGGKNNAGKTTVLEALFMFYDRLNAHVLLRQYGWRGVGEIALQPETLFSPIFYNFDLNNNISVEITNEKNYFSSMSIKYLDDINNKSITVPGNDGKVSADTIAIPNSSLEFIYKDSSASEKTVQLTIENNSISLNIKKYEGSVTSAIFLASKIHPNPNENAIRFGELDIKGKAGSVIEFLKIIEPRILSLSSITTSNGNSMLYADIGINIKVPISYMGDGVSRLLTILLAIVSTKNGVVFIDEIENGIHYSVLPDVWRVIEQAAIDNNCQIFATTHSYECLNAAVEGIEAPNNFRYFRLDRSPKDNLVRAKKFDIDSLEIAIDNGWEVR